MTRDKKLEDVNDLVVSGEATMADAIQTINRGRSQIALVVDVHSRLIGTITDGDIRRALLRGCSMETRVPDLMFTDFRFVDADVVENDVLALMLKESLQHVPALDSQGRVVELFLLENLVSRKPLSNTVIIMAGGEGRRLRPLTNYRPKPMLTVGGKPLLEIILQQCIEAGFSHFYIAVNYLKDQIKDYFGDGATWNVQIEYLEEGKFLGTAGALSLLPKKPLEPFLVINGDVLTRVDYGRLLSFHNRHESPATVGVRQHTTQIPYGVVAMENLKVLSLEEKPFLEHFVNAGVYMLDPNMLENLTPDEAIDMPQLLEKALENGLGVAAFPIHEYWLDVGHPETLEQASVDWL